MQCVACKQDKDRVVDSRSCDGGSAIRRRRECLNCGRRFTTYERPEVALRMVIKKDGRREPFQREKILAGMRIACLKRPVAGDALSQIADRLETELFGDSDQEISARAIGERVIEELKNLDKVAYVRFASVYREFTDVMEFANVLLPFLPAEARLKLAVRPAVPPQPSSAVVRGDTKTAASPAAEGGLKQAEGEALARHPPVGENRWTTSRKDSRNGSHSGGS